jgi:DNA-binding response OmpR family regulator
VKDILLIGKMNNDNSFIDDLLNQGDFKIREADDPSTALKLIKKNNPDYLICTGKIKETRDGKFFLEIEN